jgi:hypothetical protein
MTRLFLVLTVAAGFTVAGVGPGSAFIPGQSSVIAASQELITTIDVKKKWKSKKWKKRPPGWDRGRKVGWRGGKVPPGQRSR